MNNNYSISQATSLFISKVYGWMALGLSITGLVAFYTANSPYMINLLFGTPGLLMVLMLVNFALVISLSAAIHKISTTTAQMAFIAYSALTGLTLSSVFLVYTMSSIAVVFFLAAAMFGAMALYGHFTQADLSEMGSALTMCLFGIILSSFVNMFLQNSAFDYALSFFGVIVFTLLTAYDAQKIKMLAHAASTHEDATKLSITGALTLYLDFINLFLYLLKFMGKKRD
ncbi:MAG: Bax inhibitor-1/YccA family protein [Candidatus Babeliales bacterium]|nr:Bax inhibitor-1/YccA family protein [Candidatus Babeliales bacterium]